MKKTIRTLLVTVFVCLIGSVIYIPKQSIDYSDLAIANMEALADNELPEVVITCDQDFNTGDGRCWRTSGDCHISWVLVAYDCVFSGYMSDRCITPCY